MPVHSQETLDKIHGPHNWSAPQQWSGGQRPVPKTAIVRTTTKFGKQEVQIAGGVDWDHIDHHTDVVEYKVSDVGVA